MKPQTFQKKQEALQLLHFLDESGTIPGLELDSQPHKDLHWAFQLPYPKTQPFQPEKQQIVK